MTKVLRISPHFHLIVLTSLPPFLPSFPHSYFPHFLDSISPPLLAADNFPPDYLSPDNPRSAPHLHDITPSPVFLVATNEISSPHSTSLLSSPLLNIGAIKPFLWV